MKKICLLSLASLLSCGENPDLETVGKLPKGLNETSSVERIGTELWTTEDHGNAPEVYAIGQNGKLLRTLKITGVNNNDWEELSSDANGNLYIGDFGNNDNERKDLVIYKISASDLSGTEAAIVQKTTFFYPDQKAFPPKKSQRIFDCEAFFEWNGNFYLFSKNRSSNFDGTTVLYKIPNKPGNFPAQKISEFKTCGNYNKCAITAADISPDGKKVALLTSDKVFVFDNFSSDDFLSGDAHEIKLGHFSQKEGLCFSTDSDLFIVDEKEKKTGGNLYRLALKTKSDANE